MKPRIAPSVLLILNKKYRLMGNKVSPIITLVHAGLYFYQEALIGVLAVLFSNFVDTNGSPETCY